jgi:hypothetical protein
VASARSAQELALRFPDDLSPGVENPGHHGGVDVRHVPLDDRGADHHRHARQADVVLQHDAATGQDALPRALHRRLDVPRPERILLLAGKLTRGARITDLRTEVGHRVEFSVVLERPVHEWDQAVDLLIREIEPKLLGGPAYLARRGRRNHQTVASRS